MNLNFYSKRLDNLADLRQKYPHQFSGEHIGHSWPDGWHVLVARVCSRAHQLLPTTQWTQIKEKWGGLRMYRTDGPIHLDIRDASGDHLHVVVGAADALQDAIQVAEDESLRTCMACGNPGGPHSNGGWHVTVCSSCRSRLNHES